MEWQHSRALASCAPPIEVDPTVYQVLWDPETGGIQLATAVADDNPLLARQSELRPVFSDELDLLGFRWRYPASSQPLLWAVGRAPR